MPPKGTQGMSSKRIAKELTDLNKPDALPQGCSAAPITDDNVHEWRATIGESSFSHASLPTPTDPGTRAHRGTARLAVSRWRIQPAHLDPR